MKYTIAQFEKHGTLMLEYAKDPSIKIEFESEEGLWMAAKPPTFYVDTEYRKKPAPIFTNDLSEEFTQEDKNNGITIWYYDYKKSGDVSMNIIDCHEDSYDSSKGSTQMAKTRQGALKLAIKEMNKLNK